MDDCVEEDLHRAVISRYIITTGRQRPVVMMYCEIPSLYRSSIQHFLDFPHHLGSHSNSMLSHNYPFPTITNNLTSGQADIIKLVRSTCLIERDEVDGMKQEVDSENKR